MPAKALLPITLSSALFISTSAFCQTTFEFGPSVGANAATAAFTSVDGHAFASNYISGVVFGVSGEVSWANLAVQASALYSQKGFRLSEDYSLSTSARAYTIRETYHLQYLTLPVNLVYSLRAKQQGLHAYAGGYLALALEGQYNYDNSYIVPQPSGSSYTYLARGESAIQIGETNRFIAKDATAKRLDAGVQAGLGFRRNNMQAQIGYSLGLINLAETIATNALVVVPNPPRSYFNRCIQVSATYWFGLAE